nr:PREDICTED: uncharacterized protein LOC103281998 [Anolis carolinensis]|eukprot:XP_016854549.1 PREDICTED: uncharacterized protein LOC103281998 [Anolis carolinensis]
MVSLTIATWNVRGLRMAARQNEILPLLATGLQDIVILQETHLVSEQQRSRVQRLWTKGPSFWSYGEEHQAGVAVLIKARRDLSVDFVLEALPGRLLIVDFTLLELSKDGEKEKRAFRLCGLYAPVVASQRRKFWVHLKGYCSTHRFLLIAGDFNNRSKLADYSTYIEKDCSGKKLNPLTPEERLLESFLSDRSLKDKALEVTNQLNFVPLPCKKAFIEQYGPQGSGKFTWYQKNRASRLDRIRAPAELKSLSCRLTVTPWSDHAMLEVQLALGEVRPRGKPLWRLRPKTIDNMACKEEIASVVANMMTLEDLYASELPEWWERAKRVIRKTCQNYEYVINRKDLQRYQQAVYDFLKCHQNVNQGLPVNEQVLKLSRTVIQNFQLRQKLKRKNYKEFRTKGAVVDVEEWAGAKTPCSSISMEGLRRCEGDLVEADPKSMLKVMEGFYGDLYSKKAIRKDDIESFFNNAPQNLLESMCEGLTQQDREDLVAPVMEEEIWQKVLKEAEKLVFRFVWGTANFPLARAVAYRKTTQAGLDLPALRLKFLAIFLSQNFGKYGQGILQEDGLEGWLALFAKHWVNESWAEKWWGEKPVPFRVTAAIKHAGPDFLIEVYGQIQQNKVLAEWFRAQRGVIKNLKQFVYWEMVDVVFFQPQMEKNARKEHLSNYLKETPEKIEYFMDRRIPFGLWDIRWRFYHQIYFLKGNRPWLKEEEQVCPRLLCQEHACATGSKPRETTEHFVRDCPSSKETWQKVAVAFDWPDLALQPWEAVASGLEPEGGIRGPRRHHGRKRKRGGGSFAFCSSSEAGGKTLDNLAPAEDAASPMIGGGMGTFLASGDTRMDPQKDDFGEFVGFQTQPPSQPAAIMDKMEAQTPIAPATACKQPVSTLKSAIVKQKSLRIEETPRVTSQGAKVVDKVLRKEFEILEEGRKPGVGGKTTQTTIGKERFSKDNSNLLQTQDKHEPNVMDKDLNVNFSSNSQLGKGEYLQMLERQTFPSWSQAAGVEATPQTLHIGTETEGMAVDSMQKALHVDSDKGETFVMFKAPVIFSKSREKGAAKAIKQTKAAKTKVESLLLTHPVTMETGGQEEEKRKTQAQAEQFLQTFFYEDMENKTYNLDISKLQECLQLIPEDFDLSNRETEPTGFRDFLQKDSSLRKSRSIVELGIDQLKEFIQELKQEGINLLLKAAQQRSLEDYNSFWEKRKCISSFNTELIKDIKGYIERESVLLNQFKRHKEDLARKLRQRKESKSQIGIPLQVETLSEDRDRSPLKTRQDSEEERSSISLSKRKETSREIERQDPTDTQKGASRGHPDPFNSTSASEIEEEDEEEKMEGLSFQLPRKSGVELSGVSSLQSSTESSSEEERKEKEGGQEDPEKLVTKEFLKRQYDTDFQSMAEEEVADSEAVLSETSQIKTLSRERQIMAAWTECLHTNWGKVTNIILPKDFHRHDTLKLWGFAVAHLALPTSQDRLPNFKKYNRDRLWGILEKSFPVLKAVLSGLRVSQSQKQVAHARTLSLEIIQHLLLARKPKTSVIVLPDWLSEAQLIKTFQEIHRIWQCSLENQTPLVWAQVDNTSKMVSREALMEWLLTVVADLQQRQKISKQLGFDPRGEERCGSQKGIQSGEREQNRVEDNRSGSLTSTPLSLGARPKDQGRKIQEKVRQRGGTLSDISGSDLDAGTPKRATKKPRRERDWADQVDSELGAVAEKTGKGLRVGEEGFGPMLPDSVAGGNALEDVVDLGGFPPMKDLVSIPTIAEEALTELAPRGRRFLQEPETMDNGTRHASEVDGGVGEINVSKKSGLDGHSEERERDQSRGGKFYGKATPGSSKPQQQKQGGKTYANVRQRGGALSDISGSDLDAGTPKSAKKKPRRERDWADQVDSELGAVAGKTGKGLCVGKEGFHPMLPDRVAGGNALEDVADLGVFPPMKDLISIPKNTEETLKELTPRQRSFLQEPETLENGTRHASEVDGGAGEINVSKKSGLDGLSEKGERDRRRGGESHGEATPGSSKPQQQKRGGRTYANVAGRGGGNPGQRPYGFPNLIEEEEYLDLFFGQASEVRNPRLRYVVRFRYLGSDPERGSRSYLSKKLLKDALEASREDVLAIIQLPGSKEIDVCLASEKVYRDFWMNCKTVKNVMPDLLAEYELIPLFRGDTKVLTISFRTTTIPAQDVARWVSKYAVILSGPDKKEDEQGYWTGEYRCVVSFKNEDPEYRHGKLPKYFFLGADRGITRYAGQPQAGFQCGSYDHQRRLCTSSLCSRCGIRGHHTATCHSSIRCNFCGDLGHTYFWCPQAYYNQQDEGVFEKAQHVAKTGKERAQAREHTRVLREALRTRREDLPSRKRQGVEGSEPTMESVQSEAGDLEWSVVQGKGVRRQEKGQEERQERGPNEQINRFHVLAEREEAGGGEDKFPMEEVTNEEMLEAAVVMERGADVEGLLVKEQRQRKKKKNKAKKQEDERKKEKGEVEIVTTAEQTVETSLVSSEPMQVGTVIEETPSGVSPLLFSGTEVFTQETGKEPREDRPFPPPPYPGPPDALPCSLPPDHPPSLAHDHPPPSPIPMNPIPPTPPSPSLPSLFLSQICEATPSVSPEGVEKIRSELEGQC